MYKKTWSILDLFSSYEIQDAEKDINYLKREIQGAFRKDMSQDKQIEALIEENTELKLYLAAVIRALVDKDLLSREEFLRIVERVDGDDGFTDGHVKGDLV